MSCNRKTSRCERPHNPDGTLANIPSCCMEHMREILFYATALLTKHGIIHWMDSGTLLGAARTGKIILWDSDVDFSFFRKDRSAILALREEVVEDGFWMDAKEFPPVMTPTTMTHNIIRIRYSKTNSIHADLVGWWEEGGMMRKVWWGKSGGGNAYQKPVPKNFYINFETIETEGRQVACPCSPKEYLDFRYGKDWATPVRS